MMTPRKNIMLGTAGHVDHGKTALVKILTGCNTDTLAEEQRRGLTIDLGFAPCRMSNEQIVGVIDVPGHVDFIRNMVAGAHGVDVVIFVVAADDGVMPQTREHLDILTLMGVRRGIVALTKIDLVDPDLRQLAIDDVRKLLAGTFLADSPICPVSNITGEGYQGSAGSEGNQGSQGLLDVLNATVAACPERSTGGLFREWVEDVYPIRGFGTVATGIPTTGQVAADDRLQLLPAGRTVRVRKLEVYGQESPVGRAGECVAINLSDIQSDEVARGQVLCSADSFQPITLAEAELRLLDHAPRPLKDYAAVHLHVGTAEAMARVALLEDKRLAPGGRQMVQLRLDRPLGVAAGDRFVIRTDAGGSTGHLTTVGGGQILSTSNVRQRRNKPELVAALAARRDAIGRPLEWCEANLRQLGRPVTLPELAAATAATVAEVGVHVAELVRTKRALLAGPLAVHRVYVDRLAEAVVAELERFHEANPQRLGLTEPELAERLQADKAVLELAVAERVATGKLVRQDSVVLLAGRGEQLSPRDRALCEKIEAELGNAHLSPPTPAELVASLACGTAAPGCDAAQVDQMLRLLADRGLAVRLNEKLYMHRDAVEAARKVVLSLFARSASFETVQYRDALGVSRKFSVPLLDYFDTVRLTARSGSRRLPGPEAKRLLAGGG